MTAQNGQGCAEPWWEQGDGWEAGCTVCALPAHQNMLCQVGKHQDRLQSAPAIIRQEVNAAIQTRVQELRVTWM